MDFIRDKLVPKHIEGKQTDLSHTKRFETMEEAKDCFWRACKRLQNPSIWHDLCGTLSPSFQLIGKDGDQANRLVMKGDYFRIQLPAFGNSIGDGFDWVVVEAIESNCNRESDEEAFGIRIRASQNPNSPSNDTAHFFQDKATSTYIIHRKLNEVTAYYSGRNEITNNDTGKLMDNVRNSLIATGGFVGLSELQWNALLHALLEPEIGG
ncbi:MAG TPA: hypothetical protein VGE58_03685 [Daejeonella sp.]